jgi:hypothetical protein
VARSNACGGSCDHHAPFPAGGELFHHGDEITATWQSQNIPGGVAVEFRKGPVHDCTDTPMRQYQDAEYGGNTGVAPGVIFDAESYVSGVDWYMCVHDDSTAGWSGYFQIAPPLPECELPWGGTIASGEGVEAHQEAVAPCGGTCASEIRVCDEGELGGTYTYPFCEVDRCGYSCALPWGGTIDDGDEVTAYEGSRSPCDDECRSEVRACHDGVLYGSFEHAECELLPCPEDCDLPWGGTIPDGDLVDAFLDASVPCGAECRSETRACHDGVLYGSYSYSDCMLEDCPDDCALPWGGTIPSGESISAFRNDVEPCGAACDAELRSCEDGVLDGSFPHPGCEVEACPLSCDLPWGGSIGHGGSVIGA